MSIEDYKTSGAYLKASVEAIKESVAEVKSDTKSISEKVDVIKSRVSKLEYKSSFWGAVGGALAFAISALLKDIR